jgi:zinc/manganese transport system substrate-binding protein
MPRARQLLAGLLAGLAVVLTACAGSTSTSAAGTTARSTPAPVDGRVSIVAAENFWGDIAGQIGGRFVSVTSIISDPNTDPHLYQTDPRDAAAIGRAQLVIENGFGYDDFIGKVLASGGSSSRRIVDVQRVLGITGGNPNPHVWYDTARLPQVAAAVAGQLAALDPAHASTFQAGARRFDASLRPLLAVIAQIRAAYAGAPIAYTERVPGYLVQAAGLRLVTPLSFSQAIEDGNDPSPQDTAVFDNDISSGKVKVLLYNSQVVDAQTTRIKQLAAQHGVPTVGVSETLPSADRSFQSWQLRQDDELLAALAGR